MNRPSRKTIRCCCCLRPRDRESDPERAPGHYFRARLHGWCSCVEDERGFTLKVGPLAKGCALRECGARADVT